MSEETDRLARLAEDLLVLARADNGRLPLHREPVSLRETVARIVVSDTGSGFPDGVLHRANGGEPGDDLAASGLGLRIVRAVATSHRGTVRIWRNDVGGASVELAMPSAGETRALDPAEPQSKR